ncbi:MAG: SDR family oxidoreductase, partial [Oscillospiraceae bacterium]|nr:SDR family oxidoreductase [Oscillospiraceae bacterium]
QIKIRGLRVELDEIEKCILDTNLIDKVVVTDYKETHNRHYLCAYYLAEFGVDIKLLREHLLKHLPNYMVPQYFMRLTEFPYTPNGKIDKKSLPAPKVEEASAHGEYVKPTNELQKYLCSLWQELLKIEVIGINDDFFLCGGDSILAMQMQVQLLKDGYNITYSTIFKYTTIALLSQFIEENQNKEIIDIADMNGTNLKEVNEKYTDILESATVLPSEYKKSELGGVLLAGVTGYLGIHILREIIENTESVVYCIVREKQNEGPESRLRKTFKYYFKGKYKDLLGKRIFLVMGDLSAHKFGLKDEEYERLSQEVNSVINCSANVKHYGMEDEFKRDNVNSVRNLINFCKQFGKKLYHTSTTGVSAHIDKPDVSTLDFNESSLYIGQSLVNIYIKTKFEAELLVLDAIAGGVDAYILRIGNLMGRYEDGLFQHNYSTNSLLNRVTSFTKIKCIPTTLKYVDFEFTPVDYAARASVLLAQYSNKSNRIFHVCNTTYLNAEEFAKLYSKLYEEIEFVSLSEFKKLIKTLLAKSEDMSFKLRDIVEELNFDHKRRNCKIITKADFTIKFLENLDFEWKPIDEIYFKKVFDYLIKIGYIKN